MTIQSIIFDKKHFTLAQAKQWLKDHDYKTEVDETDNTYRFRQREPSEFDKDSFRTKELTAGVKAVMGKLK